MSHATPNNVTRVREWVWPIDTECDDRVDGASWERNGTVRDRIETQSA